MCIERMKKASRKQRDELCRKTKVPTQSDIIHDKKKEFCFTSRFLGDVNFHTSKYEQRNFMRCARDAAHIRCSFSLIFDIRSELFNGSEISETKNYQNPLNDHTQTDLIFS
jgi:hypothetical protein